MYIGMRKYGVAATFDFPVYNPDGIDLDTDWVPVQADCELMKDGGASTAITATAVDEGVTYSITLTTTEMECARGVIKIQDAATKDILDVVLTFDTYGDPSAQHAFDFDSPGNWNVGKTGYSVDNLATDTIDAASIAASAMNGKGDWNINKTGYSVSALSANVITAASINASAITSAKFATGAINAASIASNAFTAVKFGADFLTAAKIADNAFLGVNFAAGSLDGKGDWNIGKGGYALTVADWNVGKTGYALSAAGIDLIFDELLAGHTTSDTFGEVMNDWQDSGRLDAILDAIATDAARLTSVRAAVLTDWINGGRLDALLDLIPTTSMRGTDGVDTATMRGTDGANTITPDAAGVTPTAIENADALLNRDMSVGADSGSPTVRTVRQALRFLRNKWAIVGSTLTVNKEDDSTASWTATVTTDAAADPVTGSDPAD